MKLIYQGNPYSFGHDLTIFFLICSTTHLEICILFPFPRYPYLEDIYSLYADFLIAVLLISCMCMLEILSVISSSNTSQSQGVPPQCSHISDICSVIVNAWLDLMNMCSDLPFYSCSFFVSLPCFLLTVDKLKKKTITNMEFYIRKFYRLL